VRIPKGRGGRRAAAALAALLVACGSNDKMDGDAEARQSPDVAFLPAPASAAQQRTPAPAPRAQTVAPPTVVFFGTSLTAGYGLSADRAYPAVVARLAAETDNPIRAVNAGQSGETSAGALRRIDWVLGNTPADVYVIETGANDGLRALDVNVTRQNITALIRRIRSARPQAPVLLVQMEAPPNFGATYTTSFRRMYPEIARATGATLVPFLLEGVAALPEMNQADGLHPNVAGAERVAANVWTHLRPAVEELTQR
jgi:acyl-CoA thioesterase-1